MALVNTNVSGNNIDTEGENEYNDDTLNADEYRAEEGGIYGEQGNSDSEVLGGRTVSTAGRGGNNQRSQSENTQKLLGWLGNGKIGSAGHERTRVGSNSWVGESQGATVNRLRHGEGVFGNLSRVTLKETDSAGRVLSEQLRNELSETAMKDEDGTILSLFHWTDKEFDVFAKGDIGFHFGSLDSAHNRRIDVEKDGKRERQIYKEVYLNIKNPAFIDGDPMKWDAFSTSHKLNQIGIISDDEINQLKSLDGYHKGNYDSEASRAIREMLQNKGYDGIVYTNYGEGGLSVIAFSPDQVITVAENGVLKENSGVSEADSDESASFMPENESDNDSESVLPDMSAAAPESDVFLDTAYADRGLERLTDEQKQIKAIGKALGREVEFKNLDRWRKDKNGNRKFFSPDGYYDKATGKIYINTSQKVKHNPLGFVFRHELTHFAETNKAAYDNFVAAVKKSKEFEAWLRRKTGVSDGSVDAMTAKLNEDIREQRSKYGIELGVAEGEKEVIANFVGDILFQKSGKTLDSLLNNVEAKQKPKVIQFVLDFVHWLREKLSGNKELTFELQRLESKYEALLKESQKVFEQNSGEIKKSTSEGGEVYSISFINATPNDDILSAIKKVKSGQYKDNYIIYLGKISNKVANTIKELTGIDTLGFSIALEARQINHILKDHGKNGKSDQSMSDDVNIAKIWYAIESPDNITNAGKTSAYSYMKDGKNKTSDTILYEKEIGDKSYYVVQTVTDTKKKTLYIVSAFIGKKGYKKEGTSQSVDAKSPDATSKNAAANVPLNSILNSSENVNNKTELDNPYSMPSETDTDYTAEKNALDEQFKNRSRPV